MKKTRKVMMSSTNSQAVSTQQGWLDDQGDILDRVISATKQTSADDTKDLIRNLLEEVQEGTVVWDRNIAKTINQAIALIDSRISSQLSEIIHDESFKKLEGSWRGLNYLVNNSETSTNLKIRVLNVTKREVYKDLDRAVEFDQSDTFKKVYENEFGTPGGEPYGALIGDFEFTNHPEDIELLSKMSNVAAAAFCPFISAADNSLFGLESWHELSRPRDLEKVFDSKEYSKWRSFRESEDARFINLTLPRTLARLPYGSDTRIVEEFNYEEGVTTPEGKAGALAHDDYCWMNAAYVMGARLTHSFATTGWCTSIRGAEGGGKVENLPAHIFTSDDGDLDLKCPTEVGITDRREAELSKLGFLPLCHYKNTDFAVFFGGQSAQKPQKFDRPEASANAAISARLPYLMATSRFTHYLKVMARDKIGSFMDADDVEAWLNRWLIQYVNDNPNSGPEMKARYPLKEARVQVTEVPGQPGAYNVVAWLRPWLQLEELTVSMRMVAKIPQLGQD